MAISVRAVGPADLPLVTRALAGGWGATLVAFGRGELVDAAALPGFLAFDGDEPAGLVTYVERDGGREVEVVTLDAWLRAGAWAGRCSTPYAGRRCGAGPTG